MCSTRYVLSALLLLATLPVTAQHHLQKLWATDTVLAIPESALPQKDFLYVSLIDGDAWKEDGQGGVGKITPTGQPLNLNWVKGLNAPKGLAVFGDKLYVADVTELVVIDTRKGSIDHKIKIDGAKGLNDVTVDDKGVVYVTDSPNGTVYKVEGDKASLYLEALKGANGIKAIGDKLYILDGDGMYVTGADKKPIKVCTLEHGGDGIEPIGNGDFLVTAWIGYVYYVKANGEKETLLDTHESRNKTADIGYDAVAKILYVPTFLGKSVVAYKVD